MFGMCAERLQSDRGPSNYALSYGWLAGWQSAAILCNAVHLAALRLRAYTCGRQLVGGGGGPGPRAKGSPRTRITVSQSPHSPAQSSTVQSSTVRYGTWRLPRPSRLPHQAHREGRRSGAHRVEHVAVAHT